MLGPLISAIYNEDTAIPAHVDYYYEIIEDIEKENIAPQLYHLLKSDGSLEKTPLFFQVRLRKKYEETLFQNLFIKQQMDQILEGFEKNEIAVIPLKGVYFSLEYFGHIGARPTSDIDILVKEKDRERAEQIVRRLGFHQKEADIPGHFHSSYSKSIPNSPIPLSVEIHWDILKRSTANFDVNEIWKEAEKVSDKRQIKKLSSIDTFYFICLHGWRHNLDSPKHELDIIQTIHKLKHEIDYMDLLESAKRHGTKKRLIRTLSIIYQKYNFLDELVKFSAKKRVRSTNNGILYYWNFIDYQFLSYDRYHHRWREVKSWVMQSLR